MITLSSFISVRSCRVVIALALFAPPARSEDVFPLAQDPSVKALLEETLARNPDLAAARERTAAAVARVSQAGALSDPMVSIGYEKGEAWLPGRGADTGPRVGVSQELPFSGKRELRREVSTRAADLTRHATGTLTLAVTYALRKALTEGSWARGNTSSLRAGGANNASAMTALDERAEMNEERVIT